MNARTESEAMALAGADEVSLLRIPPHSLEAESSILGGLLLENRAFDRLADMLTDSDFYRYEHALIYAAIASLVNATKAADVITVGNNGSEHATMVLAAGADPLLWSFGHPGSPNSYRLSDDGRWPKQYLRMPIPDPPPTPEELLRERTGYWSWLKWKLGREEWKTYGRENPRVRPNVPRVIPPAWWVAYVKFVRGETKGNPLPKRRNP